MSLINFSNVSISFGDDIILNNINFSVEPKDKIGLIGVNGAGKSTLFKLITRQYQPSQGNVSISKNCNIGYMEQYHHEASSKSVFEEALSVFEPLMKIEKQLKEINNSLIANQCDYLDEKISKQNILSEEFQNRGGLTYYSRTKSALIGLGFSEEYLNKPVDILSGGQRSKLALCKLLLSESDILLLDEPTNHLDIKSIHWLENWLSEYRGTYIIISHDRYFLDKTTNRTFEIENSHLFTSKTNYSGYLPLKEERKLTLQREYDKQIAEINRIEKIIEQQKQFNQERNYITIASKQKSIDRIKSNLQKPENDPKQLEFKFSASPLSCNDVLNVINIKKSFDTKLLFDNVNFNIFNADRCFILGDNGCGKSTLLQIITNRMSRDSGRITLGVGVKIGYFSQVLTNISNSNTVIDEIWNSFKNMTETEVRKALSSFLFVGDDVYKKISSLSGGEKTRLAILKIILEKPNFLIFDEPTNNLDISSRQALENALKSYDGTMLIVSHDRYLIQSLSTKIYILNENGVELIDGGYQKYLNYIDSKNNKKSVIKIQKPKLNSYQLQKQHESDIRKKKRFLEKTEDKISELEEEVETIQQQIENEGSNSDYQKLMELTDKLNQINETIDALYKQWNEASQQLDELTNGEE